MHPTTSTSASIRPFATAFPDPTPPLPQDPDAPTRSYLAGSFGSVPLAIYLTPTLNREELRLYEVLCIVSHDQHLVYRDLNELAGWLDLSIEATEKAFEGLRQQRLVTRTDDHLSLAPLTPISLKNLPSLVSSEPTEVNDGAWALTSLATALDPRLTSLQRRTLGFLRAAASPDGVSWWSTKKIAAHLNVTRESISRARTVLVELNLIESVDRPYRTSVTRVLAPAPVHISDLADLDSIGLHPGRITQEPDPEPNQEHINTRAREEDPSPTPPTPTSNVIEQAQFKTLMDLFPDHPDNDLHAAQESFSRRIATGTPFEDLLARARSYVRYAKFTLTIQIFLEKIFDKWVVPMLPARKEKKSKSPSSHGGWSWVPPNDVTPPEAPIDEPPCCPEESLALADLIETTTADTLPEVLPEVFAHIRSTATGSTLENAVDLIAAKIASWCPEALEDGARFRRELGEEFQKRFSAWVFEMDCASTGAHRGPTARSLASKGDATRELCPHQQVT